MSQIAIAPIFPTAKRLPRCGVAIKITRLIVGFAAGGGNDIVARLMGQWLQERLGQPFVIENRPGGGTNIAAEAVVLIERN